MSFKKGQWLRHKSSGREVQVTKGDPLTIRRHGASGDSGTQEVRASDYVPIDGPSKKEKKPKKTPAKK